MSIIKKQFILHTFENVRPVHGERWSDGWVINNVYPSVIPPGDIYRYAKSYKMLVENTCRKGIVYVEWLIHKNDKLKRFVLFK